MSAAQEGVSLFVDKFYEMDPQFEDLLPSGTDLRDGMVVLLEDSMMRADTTATTMSRYDLDRAKETNRWATVSNVTITRRFEHSEYGAVMAEGSPIVSFIAEYGDGTKRKRQFDASYAWLVKRDSVGGDAA